MAFQLKQSTSVDFATIPLVARAFRKQGKPVVLVALSTGLHAGHIRLLDAARRIPGSVVIASHEGIELTGVDAQVNISDEQLWPHGRHVRLDTGLWHEDIEPELARLIALILHIGPSDLVVGEKDWELLLALQKTVRDLHIPIKIHSVPVVRNADGVALSLSTPGDIAIAAALTAGVFVADQGTQAVLAAAHSVLAAANIEVEYLDVVGQRLIVGAIVDGARYIDNAGLA
ncbi:pantoate--beta-alanine ligase [Corynebacterium kutscheri]|uniref:Panthothenate synthetase n=1 Tax=Corynebacterium kutscheri TaxID=35755 RepID=A0A0F6QZI5_9CORY|nr:pantoate--beta-alanine ligase [Corynebacterium kutscheri]AKE40745.1 panthothenate synthetase [Corynebacterium kutscheri]VEH04586.1 pantoate--beta-alanine ligase [Corynebacterium kutscheri]VEH11143.1 pantoate--beta-alanine ligase [Corynebacterium kutscheri]VEH80380.1 pantoate--beta-alanine ligase [Corynebacterium kutscheri]